MTCENLSYAAFRELMLSKSKSLDSAGESTAYGVGNDVHVLRRQKGRILEYRRYVADHLSRLLETSPALEPHVRRALGIPATIPLVPGRFGPLAQFGLLFLPERFNLHRTRKRLRSVRTPEGRWHLFKAFFRRTLPNTFHFSEETDYALRHLTGAREVEDLKRIWCLDAVALRAMARVGLRDVGRIAEICRAPIWPGEAGLLLIFVEEGLVCEPDDFAWVTFLGRDRYRQKDLEPSREQALRKTIRLLMPHGGNRRRMSEVLYDDLWCLKPVRLRTNLQLLQSAGVSNIAAVFDQAGKHLWAAPTERWKYLLECAQIDVCTEAGQFKKTLEADTDPSWELTRRLIGMGAGSSAIAACQKMLLEVGKIERRPAPTAELELLAAAPYALDLEQLAACKGYLTTRGDLREYLVMLERHGYRTPEEILAFQLFYKESNASDLDAWLMVVGDRGRGVPVHLVVKWLEQARAGGYIISYRYLVSAVPMPGLDALHQASKLAPLGPSLLRNLVEKRGLRTLKALRDWYYRDAMGIEGYRYWGSHDAIDDVLIDDAFGRRSFGQLGGNQWCIAGEVSDRVESKIGGFPFDSDEAEREAYRTARDLTVQQERAALAPLLPRLLARTGGIVLPTLLQALWASNAELEDVLGRLNPIMDKLLAGGGPSASTLTPLEADAVALVYRTTTDVVQSRWQAVVGREAEADVLKVRTPLSMSWRHVRWRMEGKPINREYLLALVRAAECADRFRTWNFGKMSDACRNLKPRRIAKGAAADPASLSMHLGVLMAVVCGDTVAAHWDRQEFDALLQMEPESVSAVERINALLNYFTVSLPDAVEAQVDQFVGRFSESDCAFLAGRLGALQQGEQPAAVWLKRAILHTRNRATAVYGRWVKREIDKFKDDGSELRATNLTAVISKSPAAFFAKEAANLCTRANTAMWCEARQLHLLVVDPVARRLAGMALLYVEVIPEIHPTSPSLVIRALNPIGEMGTTHAIPSIVDTFFDTAIRIAEANGLACVAYPDSDGMHLLSNQYAVEDDIRKRMTRKSIPYRAYHHYVQPSSGETSWRAAPREIRSPFFAYERGEGKVGRLYAIWDGRQHLVNNAKELLTVEGS
ncbi:hypothetical protein [Ralstonia pseudosolanacearum]|uniref:hypothetical protein n=1 Tax=Ralstonia pseudosolanacearum TaxID=1310165 RepID=UPI003CF18B09